MDTSGLMFPFADLIQRIAERQFWPYVEKTDSCWLWRGKRMHGGYGVVYVVKRVEPAAHRFAYELLIGRIPEGLDIDHLCRVRHCVNPAHLEPVSRSENLRRGDMTREVSAVGELCRNGHPLDGDKSYIYVSKRGRRLVRCRQCEQERYHGTCSDCGGYFKDLHAHKKRNFCPVQRAS